MIALDFRPLRRGLLLLGLVLAVVRCAPEFTFDNTNQGGAGGGNGTAGSGGQGAPHCSNGVRDPSRGEEGVDCGGECKPCSMDCGDGTAECDGNVSEGARCETNIRTSIEHCGACNQPCDLEGAEPRCIGGTCGIAMCNEPFENCDASSRTGCEANLTTDVANCGTCGNHCPDLNGTASCRDRKCEIECNEGWEDCDSQGGCETPVSSDVANCGGCGEECDAPRGQTAFCKDGVCGATECDDGAGDCDGDGECTHDLLNDPNNCGRCGKVCLVANGTGACEKGECIVETCATGFDNCDYEDDDGGFANGCETSTNSNSEHCGGCGKVCEIDNAISACSDGVCRVNSCLSPFADCDYSGDSCETNTHTDKDNCGGCANQNIRSCDEEFRNATGICAEGRCEQDECRPGFLDCSPLQPGCETDLFTSDLHCGACNNECQDIGGQNVCIEGVCQPVCMPNLDSCDGNRANGCETDLRTDQMHCGACNSRCETPAGTRSNSCTNGNCRPVCETNFIDCDEVGSNGCEVDRRTDALNCGGCEIECARPVGTAGNECRNSLCTPMCDRLYGDCDLNGINGCETSLARNNAHCGQCDRACRTNTNTDSNTCNAQGVCVPDCKDGWGACSNPENGCTTPLNTPQACGSCSTRCSGATPACVAYRCQSQIGMVSEVDGSTNEGRVDLTHNLVAGSNRLILAAVTGRTTSGIGKATPEVVRYGGIDMSLYNFQNGGPVPGGVAAQGHIFYYYLLESQLTSLSVGNQQVVVDGTPGSDRPDGLVVNVLEFTGVRQTMPISAAAGAVMNMRCPDNAEFGTAITVATMGSVVYSMVAAQHPGAGSPGSSMTRTVDRLGGEMRVQGGHAGIQSTLTAGMFTTSWQFAWCASSVHYAVVLHPVQAP